MNLREWLIEYSNEVISGDIIACEKHKQACQRFLFDLKREGTKEFPYVFSEEKAMHFLEWMTLFKHTKGKLQGQRIDPSPIQIFVFGNIYGWIHQNTGLRRFSKAYWQVGRKNSKSQSLACVGSYEASALGENMSEVYIGAVKSEQSKIVWNEIKAQLNGSPELKKKFKVAYGKINHLKSDSYIVPLSKDANKSGDGLNVQAGIIDEYHAHPTSEILDVLVSGTGARPQSLVMIITTAGFNLNSPCYSVEYKYISKILDPNNPVENEEYFVMVNELDKDDNIQDESVWEKANPILCSYEEGRHYLKGELKAALDVPEKMRNFLTKNMNVWVDQKDNGYMSMDKWNACSTKEIPDLSKHKTIIGIDLSSKLDLTSVSFETILDDGKYFIMSHSFMPEDTLQEKRHTDRFDYGLYVKQGYISLTGGSVVDYRYIVRYILKTIKKYNLNANEVCIDPWNSSSISNDLQDEGFTVIDIIQGMKTLAPATKDFREQVYQKNVLFEENPVLTFAVSNAITRVDHNENFMLDKSKATERIDPIASVINAHVRAMSTERTIDYDSYLSDENLDKWGW